MNFNNINSISDILIYRCYSTFCDLRKIVIEIHVTIEGAPLCKHYVSAKSGKMWHLEEKESTDKPTVIIYFIPMNFKELIFEFDENFGWKDPVSVIDQTIGQSRG